MSTSVTHDAPAAQLSRPDSQDCSVCGKPLGEHWFCRIHRDDKVITMCSSACFASHLHTARGQSGDPTGHADAYAPSPYVLVERESP
jgi:hypothetical protein